MDGPGRHAAVWARYHLGQMRAQLLVEFLLTEDVPSYLVQD